MTPLAHPTFSSPRWIRVLLSSCGLLLTLAQAPSARAQAAQVWREAPAADSTPKRLLWLRALATSHSELAQKVERALGRQLMELGFSVDRSPMPFADAQLAAGCVGPIRDCGARVAGVLDTEQLAVSGLEDLPSKPTARLELYRFEAGQLVRVGSAELPREPAEELTLTVRALVESVFGAARRAPEPARTLPGPHPPEKQAPARTAPAPLAVAQANVPPDARDAAPATYGPRVVRGFGYTALALGGVGAVTGAALAIAAHNDSTAYARTRVDTPQDADVAVERYQRAEDKARVARALGATGAGLVVVGAALLLWERFGLSGDRNLHRSRNDGHAARGWRADTVQVSPLPGKTGAMLSLVAQL